MCNINELIYTKSTNSRSEISSKQIKEICQNILKFKQNLKVLTINYNDFVKKMHNYQNI